MSKRNSYVDIVDKAGSALHSLLRSKAGDMESIHGHVYSIHAIVYASTHSNKKPQSKRTYLMLRSNGKQYVRNYKDVYMTEMQLIRAACDFARQITKPSTGGKKNEG